MICVPFFFYFFHSFLVEKSHGLRKIIFYKHQTHECSKFLCEKEVVSMIIKQRTRYELWNDKRMACIKHICFWRNVWLRKYSDSMVLDMIEYISFYHKFAWVCMVIPFSLIKCSLLIFNNKHVCISCWNIEFVSLLEHLYRHTYTYSK